MLLYDGFVNYWFIYDNIKPSLVVGWFEVELIRNLSSCGRCCV